MTMINTLKSIFLAFFYLFWYLLMLIYNIIVANIHVASIVLSPKINIHPETVHIKTCLQTNLCKTIYANSITLTPGTLTVSIADEVLQIHCLDASFISGLNNLVFEKILIKIEGILR